MRVIFESIPTAKIGNVGIVRVELTRPGLPTLSDERAFSIIEKPPIQQTGRRTPMPEFDVRSVAGLEDPLWSTLGWPDDINIIASSSINEDDKLVIYYSSVFPKFSNKLATLERKDTALAKSFTRRYEIWLAVHSLLLYQDQLAQEEADAGLRQQGDESELLEEYQRQERCRFATLSALFAAREVQLSDATVIE
ncbi:MAG: hypothetical protein HZB30_11600 [Nitrospirae bacterium]|nr:hypothetical protein [Nitrospirota bacterium]